MPDWGTCTFQRNLKKRSLVDGFEDDFLFYIDPKGETASVVFREAVALLEEDALPWLTTFNDLGQIVQAISAEQLPSDGEQAFRPQLVSARSSKGYADLLATLKIHRYLQDPESVNPFACLYEINRAAAFNLDIFESVFTSAQSVEFDAYRCRELLQQIRQSIETAPDSFETLNKDCQLLGANWSTRPQSGIKRTSSARTSAISARDHLWPQLRASGFSEFTDRLAHRPVGDKIEVVSFDPIAPTERRANAYPSELFRIGLGIYWPILARFDSERKNKRGAPRPKFDECHLRMWLMPSSRAALGGPTCFDAPQAAVEALRDDAENWFNLCRNPQSLLQLLDMPEWQILLHYPTMCGYGSAISFPRSLLRLVLSEQSLASRKVFFEDARNAANQQVEQRRTNLLEWLEKVENRFRALHGGLTSEPTLP